MTMKTTAPKTYADRESALHDISTGADFLTDPSRLGRNDAWERGYAAAFEHAELL